MTAVNCVFSNEIIHVTTRYTCTFCILHLLSNENITIILFLYNTIHRLVASGDYYS